MPVVNYYKTIFGIYSFASVITTLKKKVFFMFGLWKLFKLFFKVGMFTFGGGYAMLPLLKAEVVDKRRFLSEDELLDLYSIGQCTPGIIAVNVATFIGYKQANIKGAITATLGMIAPSLIVITAIASILSHFMDNRYVVYAFWGIRICVVALILDIMYDLAKKNLKNGFGVFMFLSATALLIGFNISAVVLVVLAGLVALAVGEFKRKFVK